MNYTIDASVFVSATREEEENFAISREFVRRFESRSLEKFCPTLILAECAAAIARASNDQKAAQELVALVENMVGLHLVALDAPLVQRAAQIAIEHRLRGADAVYAAVAQLFDATLITWDNEMLERGAKVVHVMTPTQWLGQNEARQEVPRAEE